MCGRFALYNVELFSEMFGVYNPLPQINLSYNIAPGEEICAVCGGAENYVVNANWGIKREKKSGSKDLLEYFMINTRDDTLIDSEYFLRNKTTGRCLIPANGFYEWENKGTRKTPYYVHIRESPLFAFAGVYETSSAPLDLSYSCSIITTDANEALRGIHDRMPVILDKNDSMNWINPDFDEYLSLLKPYPAEKTVCYAVGNSVGSVENDGAYLIKPVYENKWW